MKLLFLLTLIYSKIIWASDPSIEWHPNFSTTKLSGVAIVVHGLNLLPNKMLPIISSLSGMGIKSLNLSLKGHGKNFKESRMESLKTVTVGMWNHEFLKAYRLAKEEARNNNVPLFFVGYSLGALIGISNINSNDNINFNKIALIAPAIKVRARTGLIKILSFFPRLTIPSLSPKTYRNGPGTPIAAYNALFDAINSLDNFKRERFNIPTAILMHPEDELVDFSNIKEMIEAKKLTSWKTIAITKKNHNHKLNYNHLMIDSESIGNTQYQTMIDIITNHLLGKKNETSI